MPADYFEQFGGFACVRHLALNTLALYREAFAAAERHRNRIHVLEDDICWTRDGGRLLFYFFHPYGGFDFPDADRARRMRDDGKLLLLDNMASFATKNPRCLRA
ncbi:MAG: hypothetical protein GDA49_10705 [Rhodospirillales bacterium]|nr:hypothetical protein [Rhodospirillales bacterium]